MNPQQARQVLDRIRGKVNNFRSSNAPVAKPGFRVSALANDSGGTTTALYIYDTIGGWDGVLAKDVVGALAGATGDLVVHINSGGGDIFEGVAIHNAIKNFAGDVTARIDGVAASAASFVAMAADTIIIEPNASMMVHDGWALCVGNAADMRETADLLDMVSDQIAEMYAKRSGDTAEQWREKMATDTWFNAQEAVAAGLADEVAGEVTAGNKLDLSLFSYNTTQATDDVEGLTKAFKSFKEMIK